MTVLESLPLQLAKPAQEVYTFLANLANHEQIMPAQVEQFKSEGDTCQYTIKGTGTVYLKWAKQESPSLLVLEPNGKIPFPFSVHWLLEETSSESCKVMVKMEADLNPILKMMAQKPLQNFINLQIDGLKKVYG
ncbi:MAG: hypothetical protein EP332_00500 [Bacteroidetes bacterium]|nr:MAG: hypothetical protein EP332_00500 [Bacteroidota bacterium]